MTELALQNLRCSYQKYCAVESTSLTFTKGGVYVLLGPNGCGKSTLLRAICGLQKFEGSCTLNGVEISKVSAKKRAECLSYLGQNSSAQLHLSVLEIVAMGFYPLLGAFEKPKRDQLQAARAALKTVGLEDCSEKDFLTLSGGQQQLALFARTIVRKTPVLILDEPDSALDFENRHRMLHHLSALAKDTGCIILLCTHDPSIALEYADSILFMKQGRIVENIDLHSCTFSALENVFSQLYSNSQLISHQGKFFITRG